MILAILRKNKIFIPGASLGLSFFLLKCPSQYPKFNKPALNN